MLTTTQKRQIINSYSSVLSDIISDKDYNKLNDLQKAFSFLKTDNYIDISPSELRKYKSAINNISSKIEKNDAIQQFLLTILKHRYSSLLNDIIEGAKIKLQKKTHKAKIYVRSSEKLSENLKNNIEKTIKNQIGENDIVYEIDKNISKDSIDFISNGNICSLDLNIFIKNIF